MEAVWEEFDSRLVFLKDAKGRVLKDLKGEECVDWDSDHVWVPRLVWGNRLENVTEAPGAQRRVLEFLRFVARQF